MNLDRFSQTIEFALPVAADVEMIEEDVQCCGCGCTIYLEEEEVVESPFWEDELLHNDPECMKLYIEKEKRAAVGSRSFE